MSDVYIYQTVDGGNIEVEIGTVTMNDGVLSAVYLSLFGGNEDDSGSAGDLKKQWWGNDLETDPSRMYRSQTQYLLRSLPTTSANLRRIKAAAENDLAWMLEKEIFTEMEITVYVPRPKWVQIIIDTNLGPYEFTVPWEAIGE